jgi:hypothetical protein
MLLQYPHTPGQERRFFQVPTQHLARADHHLHLKLPLFSCSETVDGQTSPVK